MKGSAKEHTCVTHRHSVGMARGKGAAGWRGAKHEENGDIYNNVDNKSKVKKECNHCQMSQTLNRHFGAQGVAQLWRGVHTVPVATLPLSHRQVPDPGDPGAGGVLRPGEVWCHPEPGAGG